MRRTFRNIDFSGGLFYAILIEASARRLEISGLHVCHLLDQSQAPSTQFAFSQTQSVLIATSAQTDATGEVIITNNDFDPSDAAADFRMGVQLVTISAAVTITGNRATIGQVPGGATTVKASRRCDATASYASPRTSCDWERAFFIDGSSSAYSISGNGEPAYIWVS